MLSRRLLNRIVALASKKNTQFVLPSTHAVQSASSSITIIKNNANVRQYRTTTVSRDTQHPVTYTPIMTEEELDEVDPANLPPIEVTESVVRCDGEMLKGLGHPAEFIRVTHDHPERCKYCGLTYIKVHGGHHH